MRNPGRFAKAFGLGFTGALLSAMVGASASAAPKAPPLSATIEIDRVEVSGITVFQQPDVETALEIVPGDRLSREKVIQTEQNLQALYRIHGYEQTSIESRLNRKRNEDGHVEAVLEFDVKEGLPSRVSEIRFYAEGARTNSFEKYWRSLSDDLTARSGLGIGDIFDQEKVATGKRGLQDFLASEEFIGAKVDDVRISTSTPPPVSRIASGHRGEAARWVTVEFHLDLGERVTFGYRGNQVFPATRLNALIEEQRVIGFGRDYVTSIRDRIVDEYRSQGYARATVEYFSFENEPGQRHITYVMNEGPRVQIEAIDFDGNSTFSSEDLRKQFYEKATPVVQYGYYSEKDVQHATELMIEWLKSKGYLSAKLVTINTNYPPKPRTIAEGSFVRLVIYLYEGDQTIVHSINLNGVKAIPTAEAKQILGVDEAAPLNLFAFSEGVEKLKAAYRAKGYLGVAVTNEGTDKVVRYSGENRVADITLDVEEGLQYRVSQVQIEGLVKTKEYVVRRELLFREGEILREPDILGSETKLHRVGIFSSIGLRTLDDPDKPGFKIVRVSLQEGTPGLAATGVGLRNDLGIRVFGQTGYSNLWGENHSLTLNVSANHRFEDFHFVEYAAQLGYIYPYFLGDLTAFRPSLTVSDTQFISFDAYSTVLALTWERPLTPNKALVGVFTYTLERDIQFNAPSFTDNQGVTIGSITPSFRLDLRDNPLAPTKGFWTTASCEIANPVLGSQNNSEPIAYVRAQWRSDYFFPLGKDITWYTSFRIGFERSFAPVVDPNDPNSGAIPLIKQFALGGVGSIRGFEEQELNVQAYSVRGSLSYVNYRTQVDLPFAGALRIGPFLDIANLTLDHSPLLTQDLNYAAGFGFHYQTPVGPVNLDWGFKLNPVINTPTHQFYFSIGII